MQQPFHELVRQGVPVPHLAAYPDGQYFVSADLTTIKVRLELVHTQE